MIHTNRTVTVGNQESIIDSPIILYRGDREVEVEFTLNGNKFTFTNGGNVIKSTNATHGQLVINTPTGENMFSEVTECHEGKVIFLITKEMIDELVEVGFYSFQIRLFDESQISRVTIPPVFQGIDIRNPIAAEDQTNVVDIGLVDYAIVQKDEYENLATFLPDGSYNKTDWESRGLITEAKLDKIEDALYTINENMEASDLSMFNRIESINRNVNKQITAFTNEADAEIKAFERSINTNVEQFKIDTNAAMTAHKNEIDDINDEIDDMKNSYMLLNTDSDIASLINSGVKRFYINNDTIHLSSYLNLNNINDVIFEGLGDCSVMESENAIAIRLTNCNNLTFRNLTIKSVGETSSLYGVITINADSNNLVFDNCHIESSCSNGAKILAEGGYVTKVIFRDCLFTNISRMGIEAQNHTDTEYRYQDIAITNCTFDNIGTSGSNGMGISLSGTGSNCIIRDNTFVDCATIGIEGVGVCYSIFDNNLFIIKSNKYNPFSFTNDRTMIKNKITNNRINNDTKYAPISVFRNMEQCRLENNDFSYTQLRGVSDCVFINNFYKSNGNYALYMEGNTSNNKFLYEVFDNSASTNNYATVRIYTEDCVNNLFHHCRIKKGSGGATSDGAGYKYTHFVDTIGGSNYPVETNGDSHMSSYRLINGYSTSSTRQITITDLWGTTWRAPFIFDVEIMALDSGAANYDILRGNICAFTYGTTYGVVSHNLTSDRGTLTARVYASGSSLVIEINSTIGYYASSGKISCVGNNSGFKMTDKSISLVTF